MSTLHVHAPAPSLAQISRGVCPDCGKRSAFVQLWTEWRLGHDVPQVWPELGGRRVGRPAVLPLGARRLDRRGETSFPAVQEGAGMKWPRSYFHEPPDWLWWIVVRWRWFGRVLMRTAEAVPGTCTASTQDYVVDPRDGFKPDSLSAEMCRTDVINNGSCWCGKYQSLDELEAALSHPLHIRDPWHGLAVQFVGRKHDK